MFYYRLYNRWGRLSIYRKKDGNIDLDRYQIAPNGTDGFFRLTFYDISSSGYKWVGEWVDKTEKVTFATWKIECIRED